MKIYNEYQGLKKNTYHHFFNNTYEFNLYVYLKEYDDNIKEHLDGDFEAKTILKGDSDILFYFKHKKPSVETIAHESLHAVNNVFKDKGVKLDFNNDESQAYLLSWFVKCVKHSIKNNK